MKPKSSELCDFVLNFPMRYLSYQLLAENKRDRIDLYTFHSLRRTSVPSGTRSLFTCDGQHEGDEEEDEARSGAPGHAGRLHLLSDGGAQGDASNATLASPDSLLAENTLRTCSFSLSLPGILAMRTPSTLPRRSTTTNRPTRTATRSLSFPTRGCCGCSLCHPRTPFCRND